MKEKDRMIRAIRNREDLPPVQISLKKLLEKGGMGHYLNLCSDRLAENEMIDGEDTEINFCDFPDILFTSDGFFNCRRVLENYLPFDMLADTWQLLIEAERENREINRMAADFRKMKLLDLMKYYIKWQSHETKDDSEREAKRLVCQWITWELWSRSLFSGIWRKAKEALTRLYVNVKYKGLFDIMRAAAEKYNQNPAAGA